MKLMQLFKLLKELSNEDIEKLQDLLNKKSTADTEEGANADLVDKETEQTSDDSTETEAEEKPTETAQEEQDKAEIEQEANEPIETESVEDIANEEEATEQEEQSIGDEEQPIQAETQIEEDSIPTLQEQEEIDKNSNEKDEVIKALQAKVTTLEEENSSLRSRVEGEFGYSSKTSMPVKVGKLFDNCAGIRMHK